MHAWTSVTVGVADLDHALELWHGVFGMRVVTSVDGASDSLARLWQIDASDVRRQVLLSTNDAELGMLHLVEFENPDPPVREGANPFDLVPKNLDLYVHDMPARIEALKAAGQTFRNEKYSEVTAPDGTLFREIHMPTHDDINVVLIEVLGQEKPLTYAQFGAVGPLIYIVPDAAAEKAFLDKVLRLDKLNDNLLKGPEIEKMVGLPPGAALDVSIWGRKGYPLGELEIVDYQGVEGNDLYRRAKPKSTGVLHVSFLNADLQGFKQRLSQHGVQYAEHADVDALIGNSDVVSFKTPAGLRIEVFDAAK